MASKAPLARVVDSYNGVPCQVTRPLDAPSRPGEICGQIHEHCRGHVRSRADHRIHALGDPCSRPARLGYTLCPSHGAGKGHKAQAQRALALSQAEGEVGKVLDQARIAVAGRSSVEALDQARLHCGAMVEALAGLVAKLAKEADATIEQVTSKDGVPHVKVTVHKEGIVGPNQAGDLKAHPLVQMWGEWIDRQARIDKIAVDVDLDGRRVQLEESNAAGILAVVKATLAEFGLAWTDEVEGFVAGRFRAQGAIEASGAELEDDEDDDDDPPGLAAPLPAPTSPASPAAVVAEPVGDDGLADTLFGGAT